MQFNFGNKDTKQNYYHRKYVYIVRILQILTVHVLTASQWMLITSQTKTSAAVGIKSAAALVSRNN
jgi:flagellar biosynthesis protein FliP